MTDFDRHLESLSDLVAFPETPDVSYRVVAAIEAPAAGPHRRRRLGWRAVAVGLAAMLLLVTLVPGLREQVASWLGIQGVVVEIGDPEELGGELDLGTAISADEVVALLGFDPAQTEILGPPVGTYVDSAGRVWLAYLPSETLPEVANTGLGALVTVFDAALTPGFLKQVPAPTNQVTIVSVAGVEGLWIEGQPHAVFTVDEAGGSVEEPGRLAGNALVWQVGALTYRLEADVGMERAITIAESFG